MKDIKELRATLIEIRIRARALSKQEDFKHEMESVVEDVTMLLGQLNIVNNIIACCNDAISDYNARVEYYRKVCEAEQ